MSSNERYWNTYLKGSNPSIFPSLTEKRLRDESQNMAPIPIDRTLDIPAFCKEQKIVPLSLLQVAWAIVLRCYLASDGVVFGYREEPRGNCGTDGDYVYRADFNSSDSIASLLKQSYLSSLSQKAIGPTEVHTYKRPFFNTFLFSRTDDEPLSSTIKDGPRFDIVSTISINKRGDFSGYLNYSTNIISDQQANYVAATFAHVISVVISNPQQSVDELDLLSTLDREQIKLWNSYLPERVDSCIHHLIAKRCSLQGEELAISSWDGDVTYQELHHWSSQLASQLFSIGIKSGTVVPLLFEKSKWTIIAILGVMKAGAAFVLLDPSYPPSRLETISRDVRAELIVASPTQYDLASSLAPKVLCVSDAQPYWSDAASLGWSYPASKPHDALYIVFTSGSTGKPKGVLIEHAAFATKAAAAGPALHLDQKPRVLQFSSYAFHVSYRDILTALVWGCCLCVPFEAERKNDLSSFINRYHVSWACLTPSVISLLDPAKLPNLKTLVVAGEQMPPAILDTWADRVQLMNAYGPCECVGINALQTSLVTGMDCQNIGSGLAAVLWLVNIDDHSRLAPIGAVGEIVIEGPAMGRGYINHPEKTEVSFLPGAMWQSQFRRSGHQRLYKTGDLGRYNAFDGTITFVGRKDTQIKLNGQLIELREIEYHLQKYLAATGTKAPNLAVDMITPRDSNVPRLIACIETSGEKINQTTCIGPPEAVHEVWRELAHHLGLTLPKFMIPSSFIPIQPMPMTLSGKRDRKTIRGVLASLSAKEIQVYSGVQLSVDAPFGERETRLQSLWATVLNQDANTIGRQSHIFRLGGDSVTAMRLVGVARDAGLRLTVEDVFQHPVLRDQADHCSLSNGGDDGNSAALSEYLPFSLIDNDLRKQISMASEQQCALSSDQIDDIYPCTALQEGLMALTLRTPQAYTAQHVYQLGPDVAEDNYKASWVTVIEANPILRTRIVQTRAGAFQVVVKSPELIWKTRDSLNEYLVEDRTKSMQLGGPLVRFGMTYGDLGERLCVVTIHHALYDAWSTSLIVSQVERAYHGYRLPPRPFAPFVKHFLHSKYKSEAFWAEKLRDCKTTVFPSLPSTHYIPSPTSSTKEVTVPCCTDTFEEFTLSNRIRTAWAITLSHYTGCDDIVFGATVTGRGAAVPEVDQMTGPTIATLPVRVQLSSTQQVRDVLQEVQSDFLQSIPHEQLGLSHINKVSNEALSACQFQNLLVIQAKEESPKSDVMMPINPLGTSDLASFGTYAMTILCQLKASNSKLYVRALFDEEVITPSQTQRILDHFAAMLSAVNSNLNAYLTSLQKISPQDMEELMSWNESMPMSVNICVQDIIAKHFNTHPDAQAICAWDGSFTYFELQQRSKQLAHSLMKIGLRSTTVVPICMNKSKWVPVAILGTLMAGGCFTLLDPTYPRERIKTILEEIRATVILSNVAGLASSLGESSIRVLRIPDVCLVHDIENQCLVTVRTNPSDCLYVAWTSGSTGKPKGAIVTHASYVSAASVQNKPCGITSDSRVLQFASYAFDMSMTEILNPLMEGGCVCIPSQHGRDNALAATIGELRVNYLCLTPTVARLLSPTDLTSVKTMILGGEAVTQDDIRSLQDHCNIVITYGPAECSAIAAVHINPLTANGNSIGSGTGAVCWIVDQANHNILMPIGAVGELLIEGPGVGAGYLNDPEKTKATFIDSPDWLLRFRKGQQTPLYKTGDLVQYTSDNQLRFILRKDNQIKFHGQRLELDEVERHIWHALHDSSQNFDGSVEAVVAELVYPQANDGRASLAAFIQVNSRSAAFERCDEAPSYLLAPFTQFTEMCQNIRSIMLAHVPKYMIPTVFLPIWALPQSLSKKTDRKQLRNICLSLSDSIWHAYTRQATRKSQPPSTDSEHTLYNLLRDVLNIQDFGMDDNFFSLGGDSLVAMKLAGLAREVGLQLWVADIFACPILAQLAQKMKFADRDIQEICALELLANHESQEEALKVAQQTFNVSRDNIEDIYPCTSLQEGMFALALKSANNDHNMYVSQSVFKLYSDIDLIRFRAAWETTIKNNPILRTRIMSGSKETLQVVLNDPQLLWEEKEGNLADFLRQSSKRGLQLQECLLRFAVIRTGNIDHHHFVITIHHSLYDGWSWPMILGQVEASYNSTLPSIVPQPFVSFVKYLHNLDQTAMTNFWISQLAGIEAPQFPKLPSTSYQPSPDRQKMERSYCRIAPPSRIGVTSATVLQLAWALTLSHYTSSNEALFGLTTSGRNAPIDGIDHVVGPTIATFPVRIRLGKDKSFQELLSEMQAHVSLIIPYEHFGLQNIARVSRDAATACHFKNLLVIQPELTSQSHFFGDKVKDLTTNTSPAFDAHPLTLICNLNNSGTSVDIETFFDVNLLSRIQVSWILDHFVYLLDLVVQEPEKRIGDIMAICPEHLRQITLWNPSPSDPVQSCIHDLICRHRKTTPAAVAVSAWDGELAYGELDILSSRLAKRLCRENKIGPGVFVPISFEKSKWVMVAVLAVLKAGGAFLLLDNMQPIHRQHSLCQEVSARLVLASTARAGLMGDMGWQVISIGDGMEAMDDHEGDVDIPRSEVCSNDPAYICFTSGSTGKPKGAVIEHGMIATHATMTGKLQNLSPQSRVLQFSSFTFDAALIELVYTLVNGGCVCIPKEAESRAVARAMNQYNVNWAVLTPSVARTLDPTDVPQLQTLVLAGEALQKIDITTWADRVLLINAYGPTECTIVSHTKIPVHRGSESGNIGHGISVASWVVDPDNFNQLMPVGAPGELLIEGPTVGRGYLNEPEKTAAAFIVSPSWLQDLRKGQVGRLYRTGDIVRFSSQEDGSLQYLGRKDSQVKIRGQRIELEEIEYHLRHCFPGSEAVLAEVIKTSRDGAQPLLTAFIYAEWETIAAEIESNKSISDDDILFFSPTPRNFQAQVAEAESRLRQLLPNAMVPGLFLPLRRLPLSLSGKTDRRMLREQASALSTEQLLSYRSENIREERQPPTTPLEMTLSHLVARSLGISIDDFGMKDDFVRLGGDSIVAMRLVGLAYKHGFTLTVADVFTHPRLADLAVTMRTVQKNEPAACPFGLIKLEDRELVLEQAMVECAVRRDQIEDMYPCTPLQEGLVMLSMGTPGSYIANLAFRLSKNIDIELWRTAWQATFQANPILRTRIIQAGEKSFQVVLRDDFTWDIIGSIPEDMVQQPMGFGTCLTRFTVVPELDGQYNFSFTIHHALYDGWSWSLILRQVEEAYRGQQLQLRPFTPFLSYLALQDLPTVQESWRSLLSGFEGTPFPTLPFNNYVPNPKTSLQHTITTSTFTVTKSAAISLAWAVVISQYTGSNDIVFGVTTSGRDVPVDNIDTITGPTISTHPFRVSISQETGLLQAMQDVHGQSVSMIGAKHLGLQNISQLGPDAAAACKFQNLLVIQPQFDDSHDTESLYTILPVRETGRAFTTYALTLVCDLSEASIRAQMHFDENLLSSELAQRMLFQFTHVMGLLQTESSHCPLASLYSLNPEDVSLLSRWTENIPRRVDDLVHRQFESVCAQHSDRSAVCAWDGGFTYLQLDELSSELALHLQSLGSGPGTFIPVCLEKTRWLVVAVLAIIKSGSAFVLLDPSYPASRLKEVCDDIQAKVMITSTTQQIPSATRHLTAKIIDITNPKASWRQNSFPTTTPPSSIQSTSPLYCAFTSGSSGRPKGVVIEHVAFCSLVAPWIQMARLNVNSRVLQFTSVAFDPCITEILATLLAGACICIPSEWERREDLPRAVARMQVNWADLTPSVLRTMSPADFPSLKTIIHGGEPVSIREIREWEDKVHLMNAYGPTESCVTFTVQTSSTKTSDLCNIGYPLAGDCWVVDPSNHNQLVPIGAVGELVLGGPTVGRGYLNNPAASTAFISSPPLWLQEFRKNKEDTRLYKTGDLVKYNADGSLHYLGRRDFQVKIRGQRVEIGDIESTVQQLFPLANGVAVELVPNKEEGAPGILTAFIEVTHNDCGGAKCCQNLGGSLLVVPCSKLQRELSTLGDKLQQRLPTYMIPARLLIVRLLPSHTTGKSDRRQLQEQASSLSLEELAILSTRKQQRRPPASLAEETLLRVCAKVLKLSAEEIGMDDSFFQLGGDSILAIQFVVQAREQGAAFRVVDIFQHPKLADLASIASTKQTKKPTQERIKTHLIQPLLPEPISLEDVVMDITAQSNPSLFAENIQEILPMTDGQILRLHEPCVYFALHISSSIDPERLSVACQALVQRHETLRSFFQEYKSTLLQVVVKQLKLNLLQYKTDKDLSTFVANICQADDIPSPPTNVPITQFCLSQGPGQQAILIVRLCHAQYDGYSFQTLSRDLKYLYESLPLANPVPYSVHLQHWAQAQVNQKAIEYWQDHLDGFQMSHVGDIIQSGLATSVKPYMIRLDSHIPYPKTPAGITQATVLKVAWALTLSSFSSKPNDITFGLTTSGRNLDSLATNDVFGLCINRVPVRVQMDSTRSVLDLMESIQYQYAESLAYELVEFRNMVASDKEPAFGSVLTFQNFSTETDSFNLGSAACSWVPLDIGPLRTRKCVEIEVTPGESNLGIFLAAPNTIWTLERANEILEVLCDIIPRLVKNPEALLCDFGI